jgi:hypothetical protein
MQQKNKMTNVRSLQKPLKSCLKSPKTPTKESSSTSTFAAVTKEMWPWVLNEKVFDDGEDVEFLQKWEWWRNPGLESESGAGVGVGVHVASLMMRINEGEGIEDCHSNHTTEDFPEIQDYLKEQQCEKMHASNMKSSQGVWSVGSEDSKQRRVRHPSIYSNEISQLQYQQHQDVEEENGDEEIARSSTLETRQTERASTAISTIPRTMTGRTDSSYVFSDLDGVVVKEFAKEEDGKCLVEYDDYEDGGEGVKMKDECVDDVLEILMESIDATFGDHGSAAEEELTTAMPRRKSSAVLNPYLKFKIPKFTSNFAGSSILPSKKRNSNVPKDQEDGNGKEEPEKSDKQRAILSLNDLILPTDHDSLTSSPMINVNHDPSIPFIDPFMMRTQTVSTDLRISTDTTSNDTNANLSRPSSLLLPSVQSRSNPHLNHLERMWTVSSSSSDASTTHLTRTATGTTNTTNTTISDVNPYSTHVSAQSGRCNTGGLHPFWSFSKSPAPVHETNPGSSNSNINHDTQGGQLQFPPLLRKTTGMAQNTNMSIMMNSHHASFLPQRHLTLTSCSTATSMSSPYSSVDRERAGGVEVRNPRMSVRNSSSGTVMSEGGSEGGNVDLDEEAKEGLEKEEEEEWMIKVVGGTHSGGFQGW